LISLIRRVSQAWVEIAGPRGRAAHPEVATGEFAADMKVLFVNDGPVTIPLRLV
jgi:D-Tyr-tRNAtyr deacylase